MFSCEFCEFFKNTFFTEHTGTTAYLNGLLRFKNITFSETIYNQLAHAVISSQNLLFRSEYEKLYYQKNNIAKKFYSVLHFQNNFLINCFLIYFLLLEGLFYVSIILKITKCLCFYPEYPTVHIKQAMKQQATRVLGNA